MTMWVAMLCTAVMWLYATLPVHAASAPTTAVTTIAVGEVVDKVVDKGAEGGAVSAMPAAPSSTASVLTGSTLGTCKWEYRQDQEGIVLCIYPASGSVGEFEAWDGFSSPWSGDSFENYQRETKRIVVQKTVRPSGNCIGLFSNFVRAKSIDLSGLDTSNMTSMRYMFQKCNSLASIDVSGFDVSRVRDMESMFADCGALTGLNVCEWNTAAVTNTAHMFRHCASLARLDLSNWNTASVKNMKAMFLDCHALVFVGDLKAWETGTVTCTQEMFRNCRSLTSLDLSKWNVANVKNMTGMFNGCDGLTTLKLNDWGDVVDRHAPRREKNMFKTTPSLKCICLGSKFFVAADSALEQSGIYVGSHWVQSDKHAHSVQGNIAFSSADELILFHNAGRNEGTFARCYVRQARTEGSCGDCWWKYVLLNTKGSNGENLYALHIDPSQDKTSGTLSNWIEDAGVDAAAPWRQPCCREYYTHTTLVVIDKPIKALTCAEMFKDFKLLQEADIPGLDVSSAQSMTEMFKGTSSLRKICIQSAFHIAEDASFDEAGADVGTHWVQETGKKGDAKADQGGQVFVSARALADFQNNKVKRASDAGVGRYSRITSELVVTFDKGADDVQGTMDPQRFSYQEKKAFTKNAYQRSGYTFDGWKDAAGNSYVDEELFENVHLGKNKSMILTAQWKASASSVVSDASNSDVKETNLDAKKANPDAKKTLDKAHEGKENSKLERKQRDQGGVMPGQFPERGDLPERVVPADSKSQNTELEKPERKEEPIKRAVEQAVTSEQPAEQVTGFKQSVMSDQAVELEQPAPSEQAVKSKHPVERAVEPEQPVEQVTETKRAAVSVPVAEPKQSVEQAGELKQPVEQAAESEQPAEHAAETEQSAMSAQVGELKQPVEQAAESEQPAEHAAETEQSAMSAQVAEPKQPTEQGTASEQPAEHAAETEQPVMSMPVAEPKQAAEQVVEPKQPAKQTTESEQPAEHAAETEQPVMSMPVAEPKQAAEQVAESEQPAEQGTASEQPTEQTTESEQPTEQTTESEQSAMSVQVAGSQQSAKQTGKSKPSAKQAAKPKQSAKRVAKPKQSAKSQMPAKTDQEHPDTTSIARASTGSTGGSHESVKKVKGDTGLHAPVASDLGKKTADFCKNIEMTSTSVSETSTPEESDLRKETARFCKNLKKMSTPAQDTPKDSSEKSKNSPGASAAPAVLQGWHSVDGKVHHYRDGKKLVGWHPLRGTIEHPSSQEENWFYFDEHGVMLTGRHKLVGGINNAQGFQDEHVFFLDENTGAERRGWLRFFEDGAEHWYHCRREDGVMLTGQQELVGGYNQGMNWFFFDPETGIELCDSWKEFTDQGKWCYYAKDGTMLKGQHRVFGGDNQSWNWFYFDPETGAELRNCWKEFPDQNKWCYYGSDGAMLKGQHQLPGGDDGGMHWFYFDEVTGAEYRNCWKPIPSQRKVCYYGSDGAMYKGWREIYGKSYHFDEATGAVIY